MRDPLPQTVGEAIDRHGLFRQGERILVAVSGGVDSMFLLHALQQLSVEPRRGWRLVVAHFNHGLRGRGSAADERLVRRVAARLGLPCVVGRGPVRGLAAQSGISLEMAGRTLRHQFLAREARRRRIATVTLAHQADDQVELFFLRLLRGAGSEGLAGMKWASASPADARVRLVRPLLGSSRAEVLRAARAARVPFREDPTNRHPDFLRNRVRHELLPLLRRRYQPGLDRLIRRQMELLGAEAEFIGQTAEAALEDPPPDLSALPLAVQRRLLQRQLPVLGVAPEFELIERLRAEPDRAVSAGPGFALARDRRGIVRRVEPAPGGFGPGTRVVELSGRAGGVQFGGLRMRWGLRRKAPSKWGSGGGEEWFDAEAVGTRVCLRHWQPGDRFQPSGMAKPVKLQDLFTNAKVPAAQRRRAVLATTATGEIWWVEGLRIAEGFKVGPATRRVLHWEWTRPG